MCLAPLLLIGSLLTLHPNAAHVTNLNSPVIEVHTCERGIGAFVKAGTAGLGAAGLQYGWRVEPAPHWTVTVTPQVGGGLLTHHVHEVSSHANFSLGLNAMLGYDQARLAVGYWHLSNAGLGDRNAGLDMLLLMCGWAF